MSSTGGGGHLQDGPTASRPTYRLIQVLRAVAALMVVAYHATFMLRERVALPVDAWLAGSAGVDIFFVISGFVMTISSDPLRKALHPARIFIARRLERIVPLYWLVTTLKIALVMAAPAMAINALGGWRHVADSYLFMPALFERTFRDPVVVVGWTLNFEMAFYALLAIALRLRVSLLKIVVPVLLGAILLGPLMKMHPIPVLSIYSRPIVLEFIFGIILARAMQRWGMLPIWISITMVLAGFVVLLGVRGWFFGDWRVLVWGLPALGIVAGALGLEQKAGGTAPRWLLELGDASYSIYLVHTFVLPMVGVMLAHFGLHSPGVIPAAIAVSVCLSAFAGWVVYRLVELPMMRYFKGRRQTAIPALA